MFRLSQMLFQACQTFCKITNKGHNRSNRKSSMQLVHAWIDVGVSGEVSRKKKFLFACFG